MQDPAGCDARISQLAASLDGLDPRTTMQLLCMLGEQHAQWLVQGVCLSEGRLPPGTVRGAGMAGAHGGGVGGHSGPAPRRLST